jgi:hypothetical protein
MDRTINNASRAPRNPFSERDGGHTQIQHDPWQEAVVVDVIVNDKHPQYAPDGYNVGAVQFRFKTTNVYRPQGILSWAFPLDSNINEYPLLNEVLLVFSSLNRFYYTRKINTSSRVTSQALFGLNEELSPSITPAERTALFKRSVATPVKDAGEQNKLGQYFKDQPTVFRLRHDEGDILYEGRSGHSIRFGAAWKTGTNFASVAADQAPNLLLRIGPDTTQKPSVAGPFGLVVEDINKDKSSIWMVSDQIVPLGFATQGNKAHKASISDFPTRLDGNQIVINTDRFVINTKTDRIMGFSLLGVHWTTNQDYTVDAGRDHLSTVVRSVNWKIGKDVITKAGGNVQTTVSGYSESTSTERHSLISKKVYVGTKNSEAEPMVCGALLAKFLMAFIDAHLDNASKHVLTPTGFGVLNAPVISALTSLKQDVAKMAQASFNSRVGYVTKTF